MGSVLDSSAVIRAERRGEQALAFLERVSVLTQNATIALSAVGYTELLRGCHRTGSIRTNSRVLSLQLASLLPIIPYTQGVAELTARLEYEQSSKGLSVPFVDLMIGATALSLGFSVLTENERHFRMIPGLDVIAY